MAEQLFRFLRVLEYVGTRDALQDHLERRSVKGVAPFQSGAKVRIFEGVLGEGAQPLTNQVQLYLMQQIAKAADSKLYPDNDDMRDGYINACQDILQFIGYQPKELGNG